jgi:hypothetical protein
MLLAIILLVLFIVILTCCGVTGVPEGFFGGVIREEPGVLMANNARYPYWLSERELALNENLGYMQGVSAPALSPLEVQVVSSTLDGVNIDTGRSMDLMAI